MKGYEVNLLLEKNILCMKNLYLMSIVHKIPEEYPPLEEKLVQKGIEVILKFKAPYYDKTGKKNFCEKNILNNFQITKNINLKCQ